MNYTLTQVRHVLAVGRFRHFGKAAEHLGITQPALSRSIRAIEDRLGCRLFDRTKSGVRPTAEGVHFLDRGDAILTAAMQLQTEMGRIPASMQDELDLACGLYPAETTLGPVLGRLMGEIPELTLNVEIADWTRARALLDSGKSQLLFGEVGASAKLESRVINRQPLRLVVRPDHPLARGRRLGPADVFAFPWIGPRIPPRAAGAFLQGGARGRFDEQSGWFSPSVVSSSLSASLSLCRASDCVALLPLSVAHPYLEEKAVSLARFRAPWLRLNYGFGWRPGEPLTRAAQRFIELAEEEEAALTVRERKLARHYRANRWPVADTPQAPG